MRLLGCKQLSVNSENLTKELFVQLKVGFAHESPNLNLFLLLTPADLFFLKSGGKREREKKPSPPWLAVPVTSAVFLPVPPSV